MAISRELIEQFKAAEGREDWDQVKIIAEAMYVDTEVLDIHGIELDSAGLIKDYAFVPTNIRLPDGRSYFLEIQGSSLPDVVAYLQRLRRGEVMTQAKLQALFAKSMYAIDIFPHMATPLYDLPQTR